MAKRTTTNEQTQLGQLIAAIGQTNAFFLAKVQQQVNTALTLRNWIIELYIVEYEQQGNLRAGYGQKLYKVIADKLKSKGMTSLGERNLYLRRGFYLAYPQILQTLSVKSYLADFPLFDNLQTLSAEMHKQHLQKEELSQRDVNILHNRLSFSHFVELLKADSPIKKQFYEGQE